MRWLVGWLSVVAFLLCLARYGSAFEEQQQGSRFLEWATEIDASSAAHPASDESRLFTPSLRQLFNDVTAERPPEIAGFLSQLREFLRLPCGRRHASEDRPPLGPILIVGGGPAGLLAAITAARCQARGHPQSEHGGIVVLEKRGAYTREAWLDLYGPPWWNSAPMLALLGFFNLSTVFHENPPFNTDEQPTPTVQLCVLETFLARVAVLLGVDIRYNSTFQTVAWDAGDRRWQALYSVETGRAGAAEQRALGFDVLVGADGPASSVRRALNEAYDSKTCVRLLGLQQSNLPAVCLDSTFEQVTLIVHLLHDDRSSKCPELAVDPSTGEQITVWQIGDLVPGVVATFRRFYLGSCQLQVMFSKEAGDDLLARWNQGDTEHALATLHEILQHLLVDPPKHRPDLLQRIDDGSLVVFPVQIRKTSRSAWLLEQPDDQILADEEETTSPSFSSFSSSSSSSCGSSPSTQMVFLVGDATHSAHFRLGVGINSIFSSMSFWEQFLATIHHDAHFALQELDQQQQALVSKIEQFEHTVMFLESSCNAFIFFDPTFPLFGRGSLVPYVRQAAELTPMSSYRLRACCREHTKA